PLPEHPLELVLVRLARRERGEARVHGEIRPAGDRRQPYEFGVVAHRDPHPGVIAPAAEGAVRGHFRVAVPYPRQLLAVHALRDHALGNHAYQRLEEREVDRLALARALAV